MVGNNSQKYSAYRLWEYDFEMALALLPDIENTFFSKCWEIDTSEISYSKGLNGFS